MIKSEHSDKIVHNAVHEPHDTDPRRDAKRRQRLSAAKKVARRKIRHADDLATDKLVDETLNEWDDEVDPPQDVSVEDLVNEMDEFFNEQEGSPR